QVLQPVEQQLWGLVVGADQIFDRYDGVDGMLALQDVRHYDKRAAGYRGSWTRNLPAFLLSLGGDAYAMQQRETRSQENFRTGNRYDQVPQPTRQEYQAGGYAQVVRQLADPWMLMGLLRADVARLTLEDTQANYALMTGGLELTRIKNYSQQRLSLGRYFRFPTIDEAVGQVFGGRGVFEGNPDLTPEVSYEVEVAFQGRPGPLSYQVAAWATYFQGRITEVLVEPPTTFSYRNVAYARSFGVEGWLQYRWGSSEQPKPYWKLQLGGAWLRGDETEAGLFGSVVDPLLGIPPARLRWRGTMGLPLRPRWNLVWHTSLDRVFPFTRIPSGFNSQIWGIQEAEAYWLLGSEVVLRGQMWGTAFNLGIRGRNLTDALYYPLGTRIPERGRSLQVFVEVEWP
ncbi:MAG TPA: hypothetical protein DCE41_26375, partial [Cytophagales bacterium]|nr:hypothetical protein [Cytophagales bacterium]